MAIEANSAVTLTEQPLLFLRDQKGAAYLLLDRDKAFPAGMEKVTATAGAAAGTAGGGAAPAGGVGAGAKAKVIYVDHWMSDSDVAVFEASLTSWTSFSGRIAPPFKNSSSPVTTRESFPPCHVGSILAFGGV